jgi:ABC-type branched-subunit amino acid transport system ATPase component
LAEADGAGAPVGAVGDTGRVGAEVPLRARPADDRLLQTPAGLGMPDDTRGLRVALDVRNLSAGYDNTTVLHGINLKIPEGKFIAIVGPNGAGKSTLCATVGGTLDARSGSVWIGGQDVSRLPAHDRVRLGLVVVPEYRGIFPGLTVQENVAVSIRDPEQRQQALAIFPVLLERRNNPAQLLSGGEQQMLTLAPLLQAPPRILVVDEPVLGLAPIAAAQVMRALRELHQLGTTILLAEEQITRALEVADEVALLELGRIKWSGAVADVTDDVVEELYLGTRGNG